MGSGRGLTKTYGWASSYDKTRKSASGRRLVAPRSQPPSHQLTCSSPMEAAARRHALSPLFFIHLSPSVSL